MYIVKSSPDLYPKSECGTAEMTVKKKYSSTIHLLSYDIEMTSITLHYSNPTPTASWQRRQSLDKVGTHSQLAFTTAALRHYIVLPGARQSRRHS
jgi:hypothetical protein